MMNGSYKVGSPCIDWNYKPIGINTVSWLFLEKYWQLL